MIPLVSSFPHCLYYYLRPVSPAYYFDESVLDLFEISRESGCEERRKGKGAEEVLLLLEQQCKYS